MSVKNRVVAENGRLVIHSTLHDGHEYRMASITVEDLLGPLLQMGYAVVWPASCSRPSTRWSPTIMQQSRRGSPNVEVTAHEPDADTLDDRRG